MTTTNDNAGELEAAINDLEDALRRAGDATTRLKAALPRIERMSSVFDELESIIAAGRGVARPAPTPITDAPAARAARPAPSSPSVEETLDAPTTDIARNAGEANAISEPPATPLNESEKLVSFRLEFESNPGPLNLRAVDDAISEHAAVRDVALLDYDGKRASLKVWIAEPASPAEVQQSLSERATKIGGDGRQISIVALEDVA